MRRPWVQNFVVGIIVEGFKFLIRFGMTIDMTLTYDQLGMKDDSFFELELMSNQEMKG